MTRSPTTDPDRPDATRHELLSTSSAPAAALVSVPQATVQVTTLDDVVDASDGVLSLREAIDLANASPGLDTITFADSLFGGTIALDVSLGTLRVTDDVVIDGDTRDGGNAGIVILGGGTAPEPVGPVTFTLEGVTARLEDLTIEGGGTAGIGATDSDLTVDRVAIRGIDSNPGFGSGIYSTAGRVAVLDSIIGYTYSPNNAVSVRIDGTTLLVENSRLVGNTGEYGFGIRGRGDVVVQYSTIAGNGAITGAGIDVQGDVVVEGSTFAANGSRDGIGVSSAIRVDGALQLINSTIADTRTANVATYGASGAAVGIESGGTARIVNSTITGSYQFGSDGTPVPGTALFVGPDARVTLANTILDGSSYLSRGVLDAAAPNILGTFSSLPGGGSAVYLGSDVQRDVDPRSIFAVTKEIGTSGVFAGVLADNGGPTQTVGLNPSFVNPALDVGSAALALDAAGDPLAFDQRGDGFARNAQGGVDLGAFELQTPAVIPDEGLVVTTLDDIVAADGLVSLREAVETANRTSGLDTITFDESLLGGTILLELGSLTITDDVVIDGDPLGRGAGGITIDGGFGVTNILPDTPLAYGFTSFVVDGVTARFEDLTIDNSGFTGISANSATLELERAAVTGTRSYANGYGIRGHGALTLRDSAIIDNSGIGGAGIRFAGDVLVDRSTIEKNGGEYGGGVRVVGTTRITDSSISNNGGTNQAFGVFADGALTVEHSAFIGNGQTIGANGTAIQVRGDLLLSNSTIADTAVGRPGTFIRGFEAAAIGIGPDSTAKIVNTTLTGSRFAFNDYGRPDLGTGLYVTPGSQVTLINSIIDDSIDGTITSNGANTFRDLTVDGATVTDELGVRADQIFASTAFIGGTAVSAGVAIDAGGNTMVVPLLAAALNPALDRGVAADAVDASGDPLLFDQRGPGFPRLFGGGVDLGAFELQAPALPDADYRIVTTAEDVIDATDGVVSLREAVAFANGNPGRDQIFFDPGLSGVDITLTGGTLEIRDDLELYGSGVRLTGETAAPILDIRQAQVAIGDLSMLGSAGRSGLFAQNSDVTLDAVSVLGGQHYGIESHDSTLSLIDARVADNAGFGIRAYGTDLAMDRSTVSGNGAEYQGGVWVQGGSLTMTSSAVTDNLETGVALISATSGTIVDSVIEGNGGGVFNGSDGLMIIRSSITGNGVREAGNPPSGGIVAWGPLELVDSTVAGNVNTSGAGGIEFDGFQGGTFLISNSTVVDNAVIAGGGFDRAHAGGIQVGAGHVGEIVNTTVTGNLGRVTPPASGTPASTAGGILVADGGAADVVNSLVLGNEVAAGSAGSPDIGGTIQSGGSNLFGQTVVPGTVASDATGVTADEVFAQTTAMPGGTAAGVAADNGGPTLTVALLDDPANPALDRADPADAPLADQRGFLRDATPDIGAFELAATPALVVTTLDDVVDATDGVLSLREAIDVANASPGPDRITFAEDLRGGTIVFDWNLGSIVIDDALVIDGDPGNGGAGGIVLDGDWRSSRFPDGVEPLRVEGTELRFEDLTLTRIPGFGITATDSDVVVLRSELNEFQRGPGFLPAVRIDGGNLEIRDTLITKGGVRFDDAEVTMIGSTVSDKLGQNVTYGIEGEGSLTLVDSTVSNIVAAALGIGVNVTGHVSLIGSTIHGNAGIGIRIDGTLEVQNSTIADNRGVEFFGVSGIYAASGSSVDIVNSTISGNDLLGAGGPFPGVGIRVGESAAVRVANSVIDDSIVGSIISNGANTFRDAAVDGAAAGDQLGVPAEALFAITREIGTTGIRAGVLADNGGPTQTVALLDDPANPALDAANPADAPPTDQRGFLRDATPDIGAFELDAGPQPPLPPAPPLPALAEKVPLADADILGVPRGFLTLTGGDAAISFVDEYAAFQSSLGVYLVGPDGTIVGPRWAFERIEHSEPSDLASAAARPGGGPLEPGDSVLLSDLFDPADLGPGVEFGLFLVADGWSLNPGTVFAGGTLAFRSGTAAEVTDTTPELVHIAASGVERLVLGDIMHTVDAGSPNPLSNTLNPGGTGQTTSGILDGQFVVAFEDKPLATSDRDFNDALFAIALLEGPGEQVAGLGAAIDTLVLTVDPV